MGASISSLRSRIIAGGFLSDSLWLSASNLITSALNYGFMVAAAFFLSTQEFGILGTAVSVLTLLTMVGNVIQLQVTTSIAKLSEPNSPLSYSFSYLKTALSWAVVPMGLCALFSDSLGATLHSPRSTVLFIIIAFVSLIASSVANGYTSGLRLLALQARVTSYSTVIKFVCGIGLFWLGFGPNGGLLAYALGFLVLFRLSLNGQKSTDTNASRETSPPLTDDTPLSLIKLSVLYGLVVAPFVCDQILIQHFNPALSGAYAALGIPAKLVFFLCGPILQATLSHASTAKDESRVGPLFTNARWLVAIIAALFLASWFIAGVTAGRLMLPHTYHDVLPEVFLASVGVSLFCFTFLQALLSIVHRNFTITLFLVPTVGAQFALFSLRHSTLEQVVMSQIWTYSLQLGSILIAQKLTSPGARRTL